MKKSVIFLCATLLCLMCGCGRNENTSLPKLSITVKEESENPIKQEKTADLKENEQMKINIHANGNTIVYELNTSQAAKDFYAQLPLTTEVENFSTNEKIFYPPKKLNTTDTPLADAKKGTLAYYAPWGDVVMFYEDFGKGSSLYELGQVVSGKDYIENMSGTIEITTAD
jgi:hypothetical protein